MKRLDVAKEAVRTAGAGLMSLRGKAIAARSEGDQLKTAADAAAEGWVLGYLKTFFPEDLYLAEETYESHGQLWKASDSYWTVDALDGTRSFAEGYDGFCVQVAYIEKGEVQLGVVYEPVRDVLYWGSQGNGAFAAIRQSNPQPLLVKTPTTSTIFIDSKKPEGVVSSLMMQSATSFLECGSIGLKICRVAEGKADVFAKSFRFKTWDVAPGDVILREAGGRLGLWSGESIYYDRSTVHYNDILATAQSQFSDFAAKLQKVSRGGTTHAR